ncbi:trypsin-like serine protease [Methylobacterium sp. J-068]|uniref:trypsin-like serine protease n=1 Tax=Methylobacterium sp. J-068 TaxID=2836649 RepID=UPI001FBB6D45|nr:trypsin-like serine protease [Methylobacterium sp. J-068]MCJ2033272.1 trypsin-like serine protease [Methylobacterium sp. J-068]
MARGFGRLCGALAGLLALGLAGGPAGAVVGGRAAPEAAASSVMVLSSNGGVCTGIVVAPDAVLTAGHCVAARAEHRVHYKDEAGTPVLAEIAARALHPGYDAGAVAGRRRSIDLALVRLAAPLPARFVTASLSAAMPRAGERLTLSGYGVAAPGDARSTGTYRSVDLGVIEPHGPSRILVWLGAGPGGASACHGDSGGPIAAGTSALAVSAWVAGKACGGLSQGILLGPQRAWIDRTLSGWGLAARWQAD